MWVLVGVFGAWIMFHHTETPTEQHERLYKSSVPGSIVSIVGSEACWNEAKRLGMWFTRPVSQRLLDGTYGKRVTLGDSSNWYPNENGQLVRAVCDPATNDGPRKAYIETVDALPKRRYNTNINSKQGANHV